MPLLGEIKKAKEIGKRPSSLIYVWIACLDCGKPRWVQIVKNEPKRLRCKSCAAKVRNPRGNQSLMWRGGKICLSSGYIGIMLFSDDFFYPMADKNGYIAEHRLVMATHLKRCLLPWEIVHHRNGIKNDNRIENLQLLPNRTTHLIVHKQKYMLKILNNESLI